MVIEFIMKIQQNDVSKCYNRLIQNVTTDIDFSPSGGVVWCISEAAVPLLFGYCFDSCVDE